MKQILTICEPETEYGKRLMEYMNGKQKKNIRARAFDTYDLLEKYAREEPLGILLISEKFLSDKVLSLNPKQVIVLSEEDKPDGEYKNIFKYRPADTILREIQNCYDAEQSAGSEEDSWRERKKIYAVFSPSGGQTPFALTLGQELSRDQRILYLNMESGSPLGRMLNADDGQNVSDLMYYARSNRDKLAVKLQNMIVSVGNLDCVMPSQNYEDIPGTSAGEWITVFDSILSHTSYDILLIEPGKEIRGLPALLDYCTRIFLPYREGPEERIRIELFEKAMEESGVGNVAGKTQKVKVPYVNLGAAGKTNFEDLIWSELGDTVRRAIRLGDGGDPI